MKRTGKKNIQLLRNIIEVSFTGDVPRKRIVEAAELNGLIVNDTWPLVKPESKGLTRGTYNVDKMLALADAILTTGKKVQPVVEEAAPVEEVDESGLFEVAAARAEEKNYGNVSWGEVAYTEDDIADELSLMGTYL